MQNSASLAPLTAPPAAALTTDNLAALVQEAADNPGTWLGEVRFMPSERWWTRLHHDDVVEIWLLTWLPGTGTELHDHGASAGAFTVVSGELEEIRLSFTPPSAKAARLRPGNVHTIEPGEIHSVQGSSLTPAVSLHAYSPPLADMTTYDERATDPALVRRILTSVDGGLS
jgi:predicted metal-dependent enzyme (double-stranded beta helix superfamily)